MKLEMNRDQSQKKQDLEASIDLLSRQAVHCQEDNERLRIENLMKKKAQEYLALTGEHYKVNTDY